MMSTEMFDDFVLDSLRYQTEPMMVEDIAF